MAHRNKSGENDLTGGSTLTLRQGNNDDLNEDSSITSPSTSILSSKHDDSENDSDSDSRGTSTSESTVSSNPTSPSLTSTSSSPSSPSSPASSPAPKRRRRMNPAVSPTTSAIQCKECPGSSFKTKEELSEHRKRLHGSRRDLELLQKKLNGRFTCTICQRTYNRRDELRRHVKVRHNPDGQKLQCDICKKTFARRDVLLRHIRNIHSNPTKHDCLHCRKSYRTLDALKVHSKKHDANGEKTFLCSVCGEIFKKKKTCLRHESKCVIDEDKESSSGESSSSNDEWESQVALSKCAYNHVIPVVDEYDLMGTLHKMRVGIIDKVRSEVKARGAIKWALVAEVNVRMGDEEDVVTRYLRCKNETTLTADDDISQQVEKAILGVLDKFDKCAERGSRMKLESVSSIQLPVAKYRPLCGSSYLPLPKNFSHPKKGLLNIQNYADNKCFLWSVIAGALHLTNELPNKNKERVGFYQEALRRGVVHLDMRGISYPVKVTSLDKFESQNLNFSVNVFGLEKDKHIVPLRITVAHRPNHINLLLINDGENDSHYVCITNSSRLFSHLNKHKNCMFWCDYCLHGFTSKKHHDSHRANCKIYDPQVTRLPLPGENNLKFTDYYKRLRHDYVIYADTESVLLPIQSCEPDPAKHRPSRKIAQHVICGYSIVIVDKDGHLAKPPIVYHGENDVGKKFLLDLSQEADEIQKKRPNYPIDVNGVDAKFDSEKDCYLCHEAFGPTSKKCRDHDHNIEFNNYRGAACNKCNINLKRRDYIPVFLHNLSGYDSHPIILALGEVMGEDRVKIIPKTKEKYISFEWRKLRFLDSFQFLPSGLDKLVKDLNKSELCISKSYFQDEKKFNLVTRKGVYCYDYFNDFDKFTENRLPPKASFRNSLTKSDISDADYEHALTVFDEFEMENLWDYHDLYLLTDTLLLADVFENFRKFSLENFSLDPAHFYTTPGLSWSAALLMSKQHLELITDVDQHLFVEKGIRGGVSTINVRKCVANNPYMGNKYDATKPIVYIMNKDANNLYGAALSRPLPVGDFAWLSEEECKNFDIMKIFQEDDKGFILEVDLEYPPELHDYTNDYPLAPEHMEITDELLSNYQKRLQEKLKLTKNTKVKKLVPNLFNKKKYVVYAVTLKLYVELGLKITKVHRGLSFTQKAWLKNYVMFNTSKRQQATSAFQKNLFKLFVNSFFGKSIEGVRNRRNVELVKNRKKFRKMVAQPSFHSFEIFSKDLVAVERLNVNILLNKPIYVGMVVLDVSKEIMYDFYYNCQKKIYGQNVVCAGGDTDSMFLMIKTTDVYKDMADNLEWYDTSDYEPSHPLYSVKNKKVIGKFKDEMNGRIITEFVGLRSKMYTFKELDGTVKKVGKGIDRYVLQKKVQNEDYNNCLKEEVVNTVHMTRIITDGRHNIYTAEISKKGLSCYDDKRYILDDGVNTLAYGHYKINPERLFDDGDGGELEKDMAEMELDGGENEDLNMLLDLMDDF